METLSHADKLEKSRESLYRLYVGLGYLYSMLVVTFEIWAVFECPILALIASIATTSFENQKIKAQLKVKFGFSERQVSIISNMNVVLTIVNTTIMLIASSILIKEASDYYVKVFFPDIT